MKALHKGEFEGLQGISDNEKIINSFFDIRNLMLVMDKEKVKSMNIIDQVQYDSVEYLVDNNFQILSRLTGDYSRTGELNVGSLMYQGFRKNEYKSKDEMGSELIKLDNI
jgi:hypothetical protein